MADFELTAPVPKSTRRPLPLEHDPRQGSLFPIQRTLPPGKLRPTVKQAEGKTELEEAGDGPETWGAWRCDLCGEVFEASERIERPQPWHKVCAACYLEAACPVCGDLLPAKAACCPNCYTRRGTPNASF